jgi:CheY-like chemotaxis protein
MDMQMPIMDGYQATCHIRAWEQETGHQQTPIIAFTANALPEDRQKCIRAGCDLHLTKPIVKSQLLEAVYTIIPE